MSTRCFNAAGMAREKTFLLLGEINLNIWLPLESQLLTPFLFQKQV